MILIHMYITPKNCYREREGEREERERERERERELVLLTFPKLAADEGST